MARVFIRQYPNGYYVKTYRGIVGGPYETYEQAREAAPPEVKYPRKPRIKA